MHRGRLKLHFQTASIIGRIHFMKEVHFIAQGKGGVGKSFIASLIAQYFHERVGEELHCYDTDPVNPTFSRYRQLQPQTVNILTENNHIDTRRFDGLMEELIEGEGIAVVDNGAATFVPLMSYLADNQVPELLRDAGVRTVVHVPLNGGQALDDCMGGLLQSLNSIKAEFVVWLNDFKGKVEQDGRQFYDYKVYKTHKDAILGIVRLENRNPDTFGTDIAQMTERNLTFAEAAAHPDFKVMARSRLHRVKQDVWRQLDGLPLLSQEDAVHAG